MFSIGILHPGFIGFIPLCVIPMNGKYSAQLHDVIYSSQTSTNVGQVFQYSSLFFYSYIQIVFKNRFGSRVNSIKTERGLF